MIGSDYQVGVPSGLSAYENSQTLPYENEDKLLWAPSTIADDVAEDYLQRCALLQQQLMQSRISTAAATATTAAATASQPMKTLALLASLPNGAHTRDDEQVILVNISLLLTREAPYLYLFSCLLPLVMFVKQVAGSWKVILGFDIQQFIFFSTVWVCIDFFSCDFLGPPPPLAGAPPTAPVRLQR